jgi:hypothetical protein
MNPQVFPVVPGNNPSIYTEPSPVVETVQNGKSFINAAYLDDEPKHLRPAGRSHQDGTCAGIYGLCARCFDLQLAWHKRIALKIASVTPPNRGEGYYDYTIRVRGRMLDTWPEAFGSVCPPKS